jgi:hypothetical protein
MRTQWPHSNFNERDERRGTVTLSLELRRRR